MRRYTVVFDRGAEADLADMLAHIEADLGRALAEAFIERVIAFCEGLATAPKRGLAHDHIRPGLRTVGWRRTITVAFQVDDAQARVSILGVFYRGRDVQVLLRARTKR